MINIASPLSTLFSAYLSCSIETRILLAFQIINIYNAIHIWRKDRSFWSLNSKQRIISLVCMCICLPFLEEAVFRSALKTSMIDWTYGRIINGLLFGLVHIGNYFLIPGATLGLISIQIVSTTYLGYYVYRFESFWAAFGAHVYYNTAIFLTSYGLYRWFYPERDDDLDELQSGDSDILVYHQCRDDFSLTYDGSGDKSRRIQNGISASLISRDKCPSEVLYRYDLLNAVIKSRGGN